jgi:hypothetical protein
VSEALELEIERTWVALMHMRPRGCRTLYLTRGRRLVWGDNAQRYRALIEIGTYQRTVTLTELREDVFWVNDRLQQEREEVT